MFPLSCAGVRPRSNWNAATHTELLLRSWNFAVLIVSVLIKRIKKNVLKCRAVVRSCKNFLLRAVASPRSCEKVEGTLITNQGYNGLQFLLKSPVWYVFPALKPLRSTYHLLNIWAHILCVYVCLLERVWKYHKSCGTILISHCIY
jgi:hypothetical protein